MLQPQHAEPVGLVRMRCALAARLLGTGDWFPGVVDWGQLGKGSVIVVWRTRAASGGVVCTFDGIMVGG